MSERAKTHLIGAGLGLAYVLVLLLTAPDLAMSRDESFYAHAAKRYTAWVERLVDDPSSALEKKSIARAWGYNWEHPPLMKLAFGASVRLNDALGVFSRESLAFRLPGMLTAGLLLWLIYVWGVAMMPRLGAVFAALAFATMPRVFYHAHLDCFDIPIAFFSALTAYAYWRSLDDRRWALLAGLAFGLALATKHNAWLLPGIFLVHFLWVRWDEVRAGSSRRTSFAWLPSMLTIGPIVVFAMWPWLWHDTWTRLSQYVSFHLRHVHYTYEYLGVSYFQPPLPVSVPFVMTLFTVSATVLLLSLLGLYAHRNGLAPPWRTRPGDPTGRRTAVLWLGCIAAPLLAIALPTSPIFGGTKHWITAYPFIALFAGWGLVEVVGALDVKRHAWALAGLFVLPALMQTIHSHPFGLSHYTPLAGGVPGAADLGMNRQFWGFTTGSVADWIADRLPNGGAVWPCDTTRVAWSMMQRDGMLPSHIRPATSMEEADLILVHHEPHFREVDYQAWVSVGHVQPAYVLSYDGVPIISIYERLDATD